MHACAEAPSKRVHASNAEPINYSFNILLSGILTAAFVYPPAYLLLSHLLYVPFHAYMTPQISMRMRPQALAEQEAKKA